MVVGGAVEAVLVVDVVEDDVVEDDVVEDDVVEDDVVEADVVEDDVLVVDALLDDAVDVVDVLVDEAPSTAASSTPVVPQLVANSAATTSAGMRRAGPRATSKRYLPERSISRQQGYREDVNGRFDNHPFIQACRGLPHDRVPVWFMRQAGRSLPEYRAIRGTGTILDAIADPDLSTEITLQPVRRYGVDAAILYSDIVVPAHAVGFGLTVTPGVGPEVENPFTSEADLERLRPLDPEADTPYVLETVRQLVAELDVPLIGFAGAPFTVASYLVEGRPSRDHVATKSLMFSNEPLWHALCDRLADMAITSLRSQIDNGASAIQLFDSWAGALSPTQYRRYVYPHSAKVMAGVADTGVPRIHFGVSTGELLPLMGDVGADVVGVDWRVPLASARERVAPGLSLQGNLDPTVTFAGADVACDAARAVLADNAGHPGHIFNLGHGVMPTTDPDVLAEVVKTVHEEGTVNPT